MEMLLGGAVFALYLAAQVLAVIAGSRLPPPGRSASPPAHHWRARSRPTAT